MAIRKPIHRGKPEINIDGPMGNAHYLMGAACDLCRQLGIGAEEKSKILADMRSSDYEHLIRVFDDNFGMYVDLVRSSGDDDQE